MEHPVIITDYDPQWPVLFEEERDKILSVVGHIIVAIEHIGSTAVPGLGAKPIIDIMVAVRRLVDARECIEPLKSVGYEYMPEYEAEMPERRYFHKGSPGGRTCHLHMVELARDFWERHLLFRDYLRTHPDVSRQYCRLKKELAAKYGSDRAAYTEAKTQFIRSVEDQARAEKTVD